MQPSEAAKMAQQIHNEIIAREEAAREREAGELAYPAFDNAKPTDAERIAKLKARVAALEELLDALDQGITGEPIARRQVKGIILTKARLDNFTE